MKEIVDKYHVGEHTEGLPWELVRRAHVPTEGPHCPHVVEREKLYYLPRAVRAYNEGGFNFTLLCVDCVLSAAE